MKRHLIVRLLSGLVNISVCLVANTILLYQQDWLGKDDVYALIFWMIPLCVALAVSGDIFVSMLTINGTVLRFLFILLLSGLIVSGWIYFIFQVLGPWRNTFSFPVFYLWTLGTFFQLLLLSRFIRKLSTSNLTGLMMFPLILIGTFILIFSLASLKSYLSRPEPVTYLIKENFNGKFRIIYGEECGLEPKVENGRRIFEIPDNRLLIIKSEFKTGMTDHEYYLVDDNGSKFKMNEIWNYDQRKTMTPGVLMGGSGSIGGAMPDGSLSTEFPLAIHFSDFTVFNKDTTTIDQLTEFKLGQKFDSLTTETVEECRRKNDM